MKAEGVTCAIGLDIGGTKIAAGIVEFPSGQLVAKRVIPTAAERSGQQILEDARRLANELLDAARAEARDIFGIGVGVCELVDLQGNVTSGNAVAWQGLPVQAEFNRLAPARVESDVRAHALAEAYLGAGCAYRLFVFVTVGTGISACLVQDGIPFAGARGNAVVLSTSPIVVECSHCQRMTDFVLENYASGPALAARYRVQRAEEALAAAESGDAQAVEIVCSSGAALGNSVAWLANVLDPEAIIVGGGLGTAGGLYWKSFVETCRKYIWSPATRALPILPAVVGADAGLIGAAVAIALQRGVLSRRIK